MRALLGSEPALKLGSMSVVSGIIGASAISQKSRMRPKRAHAKGVLTHLDALTRLIIDQGLAGCCLQRIKDSAVSDHSLRAEPLRLGPIARV